MPTSSRTASLDLIHLGSNLPRNTASRLTPISAQAANLRKFADEVFEHSPSSSSASIDHVLRIAYQIDAKLQDWAKSVPDVWEYHPAAGIKYPVGIRPEYFVYQDRMDVYEDVHIADVWNHYRMDRVMVNSVILACLSRQGFKPMDQVTEPARLAIQQLVDAVCASVPFHLGTKMCGGPLDYDEVEYPFRDGSYLGPAQRQACAAYGGWYMMEALKPCLGLDRLREGQRQWIVQQLKRIGSLYSFRWAADLFGPGEDQQYACQQWRKEVLEACVEFRPKRKTNLIGKF
jgi:hypothetical protein